MIFFVRLNVLQSERFFVAVRAVPRVKEKLECLQFKLEFSSRVYELEYVQYIYFSRTC